MTVMAIMPVRPLNLVAPLAHKATVMHDRDTTSCGWDRSRAAARVIDIRLRPGGVNSAMRRSTPPTTPGSRTSTMATRTSTTRTTTTGPVLSADSTMPAFEDLVTAYLDCRRSKRNSVSAIAFERHLERNLCNLYDELTQGDYRPGRSICFVVTHPKPREVWAADFRDRVVHHLLYNHIAERFHRAFVADSCACIPGRGTLYAAQRVEQHARSVTRSWTHPAWYLKCDLANFFVAIDKHILFDQLAHRITEPWWLALTATILFHDPRENVDVRTSPQLLRLVPPHKSLFNAPQDTGLPIGNLSSQFFANVHLDRLDQHAKHRIRARYYCRYVDDFVLLHASPMWLSAALREISTFLPDRLGARLNPRKTIIQPVARGIDFVGQVIKPWRRIPRRRTVGAALDRIEAMPASDIDTRANSYFGLLAQAPHSHKDRSRLAKALRYRGRTVTGDFTKIVGAHHAR